MGNAEDYKEPFHSTIHNPTTFKYFGSLAGRYTPIHTKEQHIHIYSLEGTVLAAGSVETSLPRFIPRTNPDAMRSVCYVKAYFLPQCELSQVLGFEKRDWLAEAKPCCLHSVDASREQSEVDHNYQTPVHSLYRCINCFTPKHILFLVHVLPINLDFVLAAISELLFEGSLGNPQWLDRDSLKPWEWCNNWKQGGYVSLWPRGKQMFAQSDWWPWVTALL